jgi:monoamine oxidase
MAQSRAVVATDLTGVSVLVAGAGLAGLCAARDLAAWGAEVRVVEARDRVGGRVLTARQGFVQSQHAEAGADMIDDDHTALRTLAEELQLPLVAILKSGFSYARPRGDGKVVIVKRSAQNGWVRLAQALEPWTARHHLSERRWDTPIAADIARRSVAEWLDTIDADADLRATATGLRGFFLADPEELSLLALVDQFSEDDSPAPGRLYRIKGGNDRLPAALAAALGTRVHLQTELAALSQRGRGVRVTLKHQQQTAQLQVDYVVLALPATLLRRIPITPALPVRQHEAIARLKYGRGTKTLLQFGRRFWRGPGRPTAFGSPLPIGAVWDGNEEQRGRAGILSLLAGGGASEATTAIVAKEGISGIVRALDWLGARDEPVAASQQFRWESDLWSRGGYAAFDPSFDPGLRGWLAQPCGRLFFAGEHTSNNGQGYMNGAVESGRRAAAEIASTHSLGAPPAV